jgi:hypothetical protein
MRDNPLGWRLSPKWFEASPRAAARKEPLHHLFVGQLNFVANQETLCLALGWFYSLG